MSVVIWYCMNAARGLEVVKDKKTFGFLFFIQVYILVVRCIFDSNIFWLKEKMTIGDLEDMQFCMYWLE